MFIATPTSFIMLLLLFNSLNLFIALAKTFLVGLNGPKVCLRFRSEPSLVAETIIDNAFLDVNLGALSQFSL